MTATLRKLMRKGSRRANATRRLELDRLDGRIVCSANPLAESPEAEPPAEVGSQADFFAYGTLKYGLTGAGPGEVFGPHVRGLTGPGPGAVYGLQWLAPSQPSSDLSGNIPTQLGNLTGPGPGAVFGPHVRGWNVAPPQEAGMAAYAQAVDQVMSEELPTNHVSGGDRPMPQAKAADSFFDITYRIDSVGPGTGPVSGTQSFFAYGTLKYGTSGAGTNSVLPESGNLDIFVPIILHSGQTDTLPLEDVTFN